MPEFFVDLLLPLAVQKLFTYHVPNTMVKEIMVGKRVIVPFGRQKIYSALIKRVHNSYTDPSTLKDIQSVLDEHPVVNESQFLLWEWMAGYYLCTLGEVMNSALPASLKLQSETRVMAVEITETEKMELTENEEMLFSISDEQMIY